MTNEHSEVERKCQAGWSRYAGGVWLGSICVLALGLRIWCRWHHGILLGDTESCLPHSDATTFGAHALNLVAGRGFGDYVKQFRCQSFIPSGQPLFLGFFHFYLGYHPLLLGWIVTMLGSLTPLLGYLLARQMWGRAVGYLMALGVALYIPFFQLGFTFMSEPTVILFTAWAVWLWVRLVQQPRVWCAVQAGLVFGFAALVRPSALAVAMAFAPWLLLNRSVSLGRRVGLMLLFAASFSLFMGGWQIRNYLVHGRWGAAYSSISVRHVWTEANPKYEPGFYTREAWHETLWRDPYASEIQMILRLKQETREFIHADPWRYLWGTAWRMRLLFEFNKIKSFGWSLQGWSSLQENLLYLLALFGFLRAFRVRTVWKAGERTVEVPGYLWCGAFGAAFLLAVLGAGEYGVSERYRWPMDFLLLPFAALAVYSIWNMARIDLLSCWRLIVSEEPLPAGWQRAKKISAVILAGLIVGYAGGLAAACVWPDSSVERTETLSTEDIDQLIKDSGLSSGFSELYPRGVSYEEVFEQQAANYGKLTTFQNAPVVWWGRLLYPKYGAQGQLLSGFLVLNPKTGDFGGARLRFTVEPGVNPPLTGFNYDDIVTVAARLFHLNGYMDALELQIYAARPGRLQVL